MLWVRLASLFVFAAFSGGCAQVPLASEPSEAPHLCEIHHVQTVEKLMPETPLTGIEDNGIHPEVKPSSDAMEKRFPYVGVNPPDGHSYHGGQLYPICPECVKAEDAWVAWHPRVPSPIYGLPIPGGKERMKSL